MVIRLPGLVAEVAPGDWGAGGEKRIDCKKKLSEKDDGQPDGGILGAGMGAPFSWNLPGAACLVQLSGSLSPPAVVTLTLVGCLVLM